MACSRSLVSAPWSAKKTAPTRASRSPAWSSASMVFWKEAGAGLPVMAAISRRSSAMAALKAGR
jgi:hypothetical protein